MIAVVRDGLKDVRPWQFASFRPMTAGGLRNKPVVLIVSTRSLAVKLVNRNQRFSNTITVTAMVSDGLEDNDSASKTVRLVKNGGSRYVVFTTAAVKSPRRWHLEFDVEEIPDEIPVEILKRVEEAPAPAPAPPKVGPLEEEHVSRRRRRDERAVGDGGSQITVER